MEVHTLAGLQGRSLAGVSIAATLTVYTEFMCPFTLSFYGKTGCYPTAAISHASYPASQQQNTFLKETHIHQGVIEILTTWQRGGEGRRHKICIIGHGFAAFNFFIYYRIFTCCITGLLAVTAINLTRNKSSSLAAAT